MVAPVLDACAALGVPADGDGATRAGGGASHVRAVRVGSAYAQANHPGVCGEHGGARGTPALSEVHARGTRAPAGGIRAGRARGAQGERGRGIPRRHERGPGPSADARGGGGRAGPRRRRRRARQRRTGNGRTGLVSVHPGSNRSRPRAAASVRLSAELGAGARSGPGDRGTAGRHSRAAATRADGEAAPRAPTQATTASRRGGGADAEGGDESDGGYETPRAHLHRAAVCRRGVRIQGAGLVQVGRRGGRGAAAPRPGQTGGGPAGAHGGGGAGGDGPVGQGH
eukprot:4971484-Pleurochrysis_carterae.AAC.1